MQAVTNYRILGYILVLGTCTIAASSGPYLVACSSCNILARISVTVCNFIPLVCLLLVYDQGWCHRYSREHYYCAYWHTIPLAVCSSCLWDEWICMWVSVPSLREYRLWCMWRWYGYPEWIRWCLMYEHLFVISAFKTGDRWEHWTYQQYYDQITATAKSFIKVLAATCYTQYRQLDIRSPYNKSHYVHYILIIYYDKTVKSRPIFYLAV